MSPSCVCGTVNHHPDPRTEKGNPVESARRPLIALVAVCIALGACGDDDPSTADAVADASTCAELVDAYDRESVTPEEAELIADRLEELARADVAEDGVLDDLVTCSRVIRELDPEHPSAFEGLDLEAMAG